MRNSYIANSHEAAALHSGKQTAVVVKMKWQPTFSEDGYVYCGNFLERYKNDIVHEDWTVQFTKDFAPYKLGQEVYVREACYSCTDGKETKFVYPDSRDEIAIIELAAYLNEDNYAPIVFGSPATMPQSAARTRFKVVDVEAVRVMDMAYRDAIKLPIRHVAEYAQYAINKFGQQAWDENHFIWYFKIEKI